MKRFILLLGVSVAVSVASAQRYDYDDIYFNPKKDLRQQKSAAVVQEVNESEVDAVVTPADSVPDVAGVSSMSYTDRINVFHRAQPAAEGESELDRRLSDPDYATNVFVLSDGQYLVDVDGGDVSISQGYSYPRMDWSGIYWNNPWYYGPSYYGWNWSFGWSWGWYDPWYWNDPWYSPYPYWGYHYGYYHPYYHHHHHHGCYDCYHHGGSWGGGYYARGGSENERRRVHANTYRQTNVMSSRNGTATSRGSVQSARRNSGGGSAVTTERNVTRAASVSREVTNDKMTAEQTRRNVTALPARQTTGVSTGRTERSAGETRRTVTTLPARPSRSTMQSTERSERSESTSVYRGSTSTGRSTTSVGRGSSSSTRRSTSIDSRSTSTNRNASSVNRSSSTRRSSSSSYSVPRSSSSSRSGFSGGGRSSSGASSTRRR